GERVFSLTSLPPEIQKIVATRTDVPAYLLPDLAPEAALAAATKAMGECSLYNKEALTPHHSHPPIGMDVLRDRKVQEWTRIIQEAMSVPKGHKKRAWIEFVAAKHGVAWQTVYRKIKRYEKRGLAGLKHTKSTKSQPKTWTPEAVDFWCGLCLKKEHRKLDKNILYAILREEAQKRDWRTGGYESALWWFHKRVNPQLLALQRGGLRALDNALPPVLRDYSDLNPFEMLVGDQHRFDFWVVDDDTGEVFRPEGYFWQDLRTRLIYGGTVDRKYDSYLIGLALRMGLKIWGAFDAIYTDNGKPELSRYVMGVMADMRAVGLSVHPEMDAPVDCTGVDPELLNPCAIQPGTHRKAIVRNAKAKMIEGTFSNLESVLRNTFRVPGQVKRLGGPAEENEVDQKEIDRLAREGKLLTFWEFAATLMKAMDHYNSQKAHRGVLKEWIGKPKPKSATPMDCLRRCYMDGWRPGKVSDEAIDLIFLPRANRVIDRGRIRFRNEIYEHEDLIALSGSRCECRYDPLDPDWLMVFQNGQYIAPARPVVYSSMKDTALAKMKIEEKRRRRKGFILEYRQLTSKIPDFMEYSKTPEIERAAAIIGREKRRVLEERQAVLPPPAEQLAEEVAKIESYQPPRPLFQSEAERYRWILDQQLDGQTIEQDDAGFMAAFEAKMDPDTREYWELYQESIGMAGGKGA
uniref:Mu transposase C-terminal domain-containing protein n=1 Tax=Desulfatiglans anilini TaxID=90728 RepID=UPI0004822981